MIITPLNESVAKVTSHHRELDGVRDRYAKRATSGHRQIYSRFNAYANYSWQEREAALLNLLKKNVKLDDLARLRCLEIGCGSGDNLLQLLNLGFAPGNLVGNELLEHRAAQARARLPVNTAILTGDARTLPYEPASFDIVYQSTVFSSLLDDGFQNELASAMWTWVKPGGGVLWYDFIYSNPANPDVRGVSILRMRKLFPHAKPQIARVTLAPPIGRRLARFAPGLVRPVNALLPVLRTHVVAWLTKPLG